MYSKKIITIIIFVVVFFLIGFLSFVAKNKNCLLLYKHPYQKNIATNTWNYYHDDRYGFSVMYPNNLNIDSIYEKKMITSRDGSEFYVINGGVSFSLDSKGVYGVLVFENPGFTTFDEWIKNENSKLKSEHIVVENNILIDSREAIVTHTVSNQKPCEEYKSYKKAVLFNNNKLFVLYANADNYMKFWNSFSFDKKSTK